ncbi:MAG: sigma-70 family RNA polymerase sigma factor [Saprospiraceae bacterium]|nr:sigma-70 family RNA polymerase sigma factor [Saprospiraceae bacterium]
MHLIEAYVTGNDEALEALFFKKGYYDSCFFKARRYLHNDYNGHDAHTVAEDTFLALREKNLPERVIIFERGGRTEKGFRNYMLTIAQNKANDLGSDALKKPVSLPKDIADKPEEAALPNGEDESHPSELLFQQAKKVDDCAESMKEIEATNPVERGRRPLDSEFLEVWRLVGDYDNGPLRDEFGLTDEQIRVTKQRIMRRLRRCLGID